MRTGRLICSMCKGAPNGKPSRKEELVKRLLLRSRGLAMTVCVGVYKGGEIKMETYLFRGAVNLAEKWERDESSSRRTEFFDIFKGGERSTSRPASESWGDSDISLGRSLSQARYPPGRSATQTRRGVGRGGGGTNRLSRLLRPTRGAADKPRSLGRWNPLPGAVLGELTGCGSSERAVQALGDRTPRGWWGRQVAQQSLEPQQRHTLPEAWGGGEVKGLGGVRG